MLDEPIVPDSVTVTSRRPTRVGAGAPPLSPRLVVAFECGRPLAPALRLSLTDVDEVVIGRGPGRRWSRAGRQLVVTVGDAEMSRMHVRLVRRHDGWRLEDIGSKNGTLVSGTRIERCTLADSDVIQIAGTVLVYRDRAGQCAPGDRDLAADQETPAAFRSLSLDVERRALDLMRVAPTAIPVLVAGETGTGKELVAAAIHDLSGRSGPFVAVNCGALPRTLIESELFGHRRGAFSGAGEDRTGLARRASGGTLFLDEVAELPAESQAALLRLLQQGEVRPVGSAETITVDVRVIAATHQDLRARIADGRFRRDLYGRLSGYEVHLPPLRERREDIGSLVSVLLRRMGAENAFEPRAAFGLFVHSYPMNVRELEQALATAAALAGSGPIELEHLPEAIRASVHATPAELGPEEAALQAKLVDLLRENGGNVSATARALEKAPIQVRRWCRRLGIELADYKR
jgi:DNA-binding NtrC family response regulator